jgi:hypothetical protein
MTVTVGNVIVGLAQLYVAPYGASGEPAPADTVAKGAPWGGNWVAMGGTSQGVAITMAPKTVDITIEEQMTPADVVIDTMDISVKVTLSEDVIASMQLAYGGGGVITTQAATGTLIGKTTLTLADSLANLSVGFEATNSFGYWRRVYIPKIVSVASVETSYRRAKAQRMYPVTLRAICDPSLIDVVDQTAPIT